MTLCQYMPHSCRVVANCTVLEVRTEDPAPAEACKPAERSHMLLERSGYAVSVMREHTWLHPVQCQINLDYSRSIVQDSRPNVCERE